MVATLKLYLQQTSSLATQIASATTLLHFKVRFYAQARQYIFSINTITLMVISAFHFVGISTAKKYLQMYLLEHLVLVMMPGF